MIKQKAILLSDWEHTLREDREREVNFLITEVQNAMITRLKELGIKISPKQLIKLKMNFR